MPSRIAVAALLCLVLAVGAAPASAGGPARAKRAVGTLTAKLGRGDAPTRAKRGGFLPRPAGGKSARSNAARGKSARSNAARGKARTAQAPARRAPRIRQRLTAARRMVGRVARSAGRAAAAAAIVVGVVAAVATPAGLGVLAVLALGPAGGGFAYVGFLWTGYFGMRIFD